MPPLSRRRRALIASAFLALGCPSAKAPKGTHELPKPPPGVEVHAASGRPRLVVVRRDGDPSGAVAVELRSGEGDDLRLALVSALIGARLEAASFGGLEIASGARVARVRALVPQLGATTANQLDAALSAPVQKDEPAMGAVRRALDAFAARPVSEPAIARMARCLERPTRPASFKRPDDVVTFTETARLALVHSDTVNVGAVGAGNTDPFAQAWRALPAFTGSVVRPPEPVTSASAVTLSVAHEGGVVVVEGGPRAALPAALPLLGDLDGPLASRLRAADDFRLRSVSGVAHPDGACVVVEVEPSSAARAVLKDPERLASRTAVALEVARQEIELALESKKASDDGEAAKIAIGSGGDPREAADRAAFWAWPVAPVMALSSSATLTVPASLVAKGPSLDAEAALAALGPKFGQAVQKARLAWTKNEIELKTHVEAGQGELWVALGSPCAVAHEGTQDAGTAAIAMRALASAHVDHLSDSVTVEPWSATTGVGLVAHASPRAGESSAALAHRVGDAVGRLFLATFPEAEHLAGARAEGLDLLTVPFTSGELVRTAVKLSSPLHPSWLEPQGTLEAVAKVGLEQVDLRLSTLRSGTLRLSVLANVDEAQTDAVARAAERWVPRRPGEARTCPTPDPGAPPKGGLHPITVKSGTGIALSLPVEESQREVASTLAALLDGANGRLAAELGAGLATRWEARLVRGAARHALVIVALAPDPNVDAVVTRVRALLASLRGGAIEAADLARADRDRIAARTARRLDPRARVVDLFSADLLATPPAVELAQLRAGAAKLLDEDKTQLVVARLAK